ncbi:hypothetical protein BJX76DRAFT_72846 [Aspergillus varians]
MRGNALPAVRLDPRGDVTIKVHGFPAKLINALIESDLHPDVVTGLPALMEDEASVETEQSPMRNEEPLSILASSKHLILGSTYFATILLNFTYEADEDPDSRFFRQSTKSDGVAFIYMLAIMHCRNHLIPTSVPFKTLADMAILVNYYDCYEAVKAIADTWINQLASKPIPYSTEDIGLRWVLIAWVFHRNDIFHNATRELINESPGRIGVGCTLPIPYAVLDTINAARTRHLGHLIGELRLLRDHITEGCRKVIEENGPQAGRTQDGDMCVYYVVRAYSYVMMRMRLSHPEPEGPFYPGLSIRTIIAGCEEVEITEGAAYEEGGEHSECSIASRLGVFLDAYRMPTGLDMTRGW